MAVVLWPMASGLELVRVIDLAPTTRVDCSCWSSAPGSTFRRNRSTAPFRREPRVRSRVGYHNSRWLGCTPLVSEGRRPNFRENRDSLDRHITGEILVRAIQR